MRRRKVSSMKRSKSRQSLQPYVHATIRVDNTTKTMALPSKYLPTLLDQKLLIGPESGAEFTRLFPDEAYYYAVAPIVLMNIPEAFIVQ